MSIGEESRKASCIRERASEAHGCWHNQDGAPCSAFELVLPALPESCLCFRKFFCRYVLFKYFDILLAKIVLGFGSDYRGHTLCFKFPARGYELQYTTVLYDGEKKNWRLCRYGPCHTCRQSPLAFVIHSDCIKVLRTRRPKPRLSHMWHLGLWLNPIPGALITCQSVTRLDFQ